MTAVPTVTVTLDAVNVNTVTIADLSITYGRTSVLEQPDPSALSMVMLTDQVVKVPKVGQRITVVAKIGAVSYTRFTGTVTAVTANLYTTQVTATSGALGSLARLASPDQPLLWGLPGAGLNINELLSRSGALKGPYAPSITYSPGDTTIVPTTVLPAGSILSQCQALASYDSYGVFFETPDGNLRFTDGNDRAFIDSASADIYLNVALTGGGDSPITLDWQATQSLDGLVNQSVVNYGSPPASVSVTDATSVSSWGLFGSSTEYPVVSVNDAIRKASRTVANYSQPRTVTNPVTVELGAMTTGVQASLLSALVGTSVSWLPGAASSGIPGLPDNCFIEGWTERITGQGSNLGRHSMAFTLSDVKLTRTMQKWSQVTGSLRWNAVGATVSWYALAGQNL